jgi:RNA polymerase sigma factor (sigma-70 family)
MELVAMNGEQSASAPAALKRLLADGSLTGLSESQLLERFFSRGDEDAFEAIVRRHGSMVLGVCRRLLSNPHDVEDAFQATFLILVKKADSIRNREVLGTWLYGVAYRVAVRAKADARRRRVGVLRLAQETARDCTGMTWDDSAELRSIIDDEVSRLTHRYRAAVILCDLEGQTYEQTADLLRCPVGTVKSRLARGREQLRKRLARRGFTPSSAVLARVLEPDLSSALPDGLIGVTLESVNNLVAGRMVATGIGSVALAKLVEGTLRGMSMNILKLAAAVVAAAGLIATGAGVFAFQTPGKKGHETAVNSGVKGEPAIKGIPKPGGRDSDQTPPKTKGALDTVGNGTIASLAKARLNAAVRYLELARKSSRENPRARPEHFHLLQSGALRALLAQQELSDTKANKIAALKSYLEVLKEAQKLLDTEEQGLMLEAQYYRMEAELWLAQARLQPDLTGSPSPAQKGSTARERPGTDPKSQALLARLEDEIPMNFPNPTPLRDVLKYIENATAGPDEAIQIYVDPATLQEDEKNASEKLMKSPITIKLNGIPLRRSLKLIAEQIGMGYGIRDGVVMMRPPDQRTQNWQELMVMEETFPMSSPLEREILSARRGEMTPAELDQLNERLKAIEEVTKRAASIRTMRFNPQPQQGGMMRAMPAPTPPAGQLPQ